MKTLQFLFMTLVLIIFLGFGLQPANADDANGISIQNIKVQPSTVKVGNTFTVTATLVNNSTVPIVLDSGTCSIKDMQVPFFTVTFDNHVKIKSKNMTCAGVGLSQILNPGKNSIGTSPDSTLVYIATESGTANVTVAFSYYVKNQTDPNQPDIRQTISKSLMFTIYDNSTGSKPVNAIVLSPLKQLKSGIKIQDIVCKQGLTLLVSHYGSPACIMPEHVQKFVQNNWSIVDVSTKYSHIDLQVWGSYSPETLQDHFLRGSISSRAGPISNATILISVNGVPMGNTTSTSDGCFQFNQWDEQRFSSKIEEFVKDDQTKIEHSPIDLLFTARYLGNENHNPVTATQDSYLYLYLVPLAPSQYDTSISPSSEINITQGNSVQFQVTIKPFSKYWGVQHMKLGLQRTPCGLTYDILPTGNNSDSTSENHPASFNVTLNTASNTPLGKYWIMITQDTSGLDNSNIDSDVGAVFLDVMKK